MSFCQFYLVSFCFADRQIGYLPNSLKRLQKDNKLDVLEMIQNQFQNLDKNESTNARFKIFCTICYLSTFNDQGFHVSRIFGSRDPGLG